MSEGQGSRRNLEGKISQEGRLPPGQSLTVKFPVLHYGPVPTFDPSKWEFRVWGDVDQEVTWTWDEFLELPRTKVKMDIHCVTRWSKFDTEWEGVSLQTLVQQEIIKVKPSAKFLLQHCDYGYSTNMPISIAMSDNFLLATHFDGQPLTPDHGYPLRGVVGAIPGMEGLKDIYLWKGGKWLRGLEFMTEDRLGFWEQAGYHNDADVWEEQRFASDG
ncbi:MAG: molybdopterin-dependent oxidoreductase [Anaerolineales bacterium]|nr:molybdopterin-dependent oxidoreductase [Anaerolineales bacterium]